MTPNQQTVERYMEGFRRTDTAQVMSCLTDDVEWVLPGMFHARGRDEFQNHLIEEGFRPNPRIDITRLIESADVIVAEGRVRTEKTDGTVVNIAFCDVFEMRNARICKLTSYLAVS
jgi:ketosteroid isomerase-like protein